MSAPLTEAEKDTRRRLTTEFIEANPRLVSFERPTMVDDGAGGLKPGAPDPLPPQRVRIVAPNRELPVRQTVDGRSIQPSYTLVSDWDADIAAGDRLKADGVTYEVVYVQPDHLDATRAELVYGV